MNPSKRIILLVAVAANAVSMSAVRQAAAADSVKGLFDLKARKPTAKKGDFVLCPSRQFYEAAREKGLDKTTFTYYAATMVEAHDTQSRVKNLAGREFSLPNQLIISIPGGQRTQVGDILLSWWQKGSGMQRAIVVGGTATRPAVRYLDIKLDNPSGAGRKEATLRPNSFCVLTDSWQIGTAVRIKDPERPKVEVYGQLLAIDERNVLVRGWAGKLSVHPRKAAQPIPITPDLKPNDAVQVALFGSFKPATVLSVDDAVGRVFAKYQFGRKDKEAAFAFGDLYAN